MKKLFLASKGITDKLAPTFSDFVGQSRCGYQNPKGLIIENASDYKGEVGQAKLREYYQILKSYNLNFEYLDLKKYWNKQSKLTELLSEADFIYITGGYLFYLYYWITKSNLDKLLRSEVENGLIYASSSAGTIVTGPTLKYMDLVDDISTSPEPQEVKWEGMNLVDFVPFTHWNEDKYQRAFDIIDEKLKADGYATRYITNSQVLIIDGQKESLISE